MADLGYVALLAVASIASVFMAWAVGAIAIGGAPFAPAVGADAIPTMRAAFFLGIIGFAGAVLQGSTVAETIGRGVVADATVTPLAASIAVLLAAGLMAVGIVADYPIPAAFTVTGAVAGVGFALGGTPVWDLYVQFAILWIAAPLAVAAVAFLLALSLSSDRVSEERSLSCLVAAVGLSLVVLEFPFLADEGTRSVLGVVADLEWVPADWAAVIVPIGGVGTGWLVGRISVRRRGVTHTQRLLLVALGGLVAFAGGGNQIGLAAGPLLPLLEPTAVPSTAVIIGAAVVLVVGAWTGATRLINAIARDYASLTPERAIAALFPAFVVAQVGVQVGVPISFNEIIIATIVGSGLPARHNAAIGKRKLTVTVAAWCLSLAAALSIGYAVVRLSPMRI